MSDEPTSPSSGPGEDAPPLSEEAPSQQRRNAPPIHRGPRAKFRRELEFADSQFGLTVLDAMEQKQVEVGEVIRQMEMPTNSFYRWMRNDTSAVTSDLHLALRVVQLAHVLGLDPSELLQQFIDDRDRLPVRRKDKRVVRRETYDSVRDAAFPFGLRVLAAMETQHMTFATLQAATGLNHQTFFRMMRGDPELVRSKRSVSAIVRIAIVLGLPPEELIGLFFYDDVTVEAMRAYLYMGEVYLVLPETARMLAVNMFTAIRQSVTPGYPVTEDET